MASIHEQPSWVEPTNLRLDQAPVMYRSLDEVCSRRGLSVHFIFPDEPIVARDSYSFVFSRLGEYVEREYPGWKVRAFGAVYENVPHGEVGGRVLVTVKPYPDCFKELPKLVEELRARTGNFWTGGIGNKVSIEPISTCGKQESSYNNNNRIWEEFVPRMVVPMADLEVPVTENCRMDISGVIEILAQNGFSGMILRSGRLGRGNYHYLGDFLLPAQPFAWQVKGRLIELLTPGSDDKYGLEAIGHSLNSTESFLEACRIAQNILEQVPSGTKTSSMIDARWVAHSFLRKEGCVLRTESGRYYLEGPKLVAEIF